MTNKRGSIRNAATKDVPPVAIWDRPPAREKGDEDADEIYRAMGSALSTWEMVEDVFATLFQELVDSESIAAKRAYGAVVASGGRRDLLKAAAEVYFHIHKIDDDFRATFKNLIEHFNLAGVRRNEIAHGHVITLFHMEEEIGSFLVPPSYNSRKTEAFVTPRRGDKFSILMGDYRYTSEDINTFSTKLTSFHGIVLKFSVSLSQAARRQ